MSHGSKSGEYNGWLMIFVNVLVLSWVTPEGLSDGTPNSTPY